MAKTLADALSDSGFEAQSTVSRLAEFNAVQNTYLTTFQALGAMGLLLGSLGLGIVVLRNMLERRSEMAMLRALGFSRGDIGVSIFAEHALLMVLGLSVGVLAALTAVAPTLKGSGDLFRWRAMHSMLLGDSGDGDAGGAVGGVEFVARADFEEPHVGRINVRQAGRLRYGFPKYFVCSKNLKWCIPERVLRSPDKEKGNEKRCALLQWRCPPCCACPVATMDDVGRTRALRM